MATTTSKEKSHSLIETVLLGFVGICFVLIIIDISHNIVSEINGMAQTAVMTQSHIEVTPVPTLTEEQYRDLLGIEGSGTR